MAAAKAARGGSAEDFSAWLGAAGYREGEVREIVALTLHGSRTDPTCENWEEVEALCSQMDLSSSHEQITLLDIKCDGDEDGSDDDCRDVVYSVCGTSGICPNSSSDTSSTRTSSSSSGGSSSPIAGYQQQQPWTANAVGSPLKALGGLTGHMSRSSSSDAHTSVARYLSPDPVRAIGGGGGSGGNGGISASKLSFSGPLQLARKLTALAGGRGRSSIAIPTPSASPSPSAFPSPSVSASAAAASAESPPTSALSGRSGFSAAAAATAAAQSPSPSPPRARRPTSAAAAVSSSAGSPLRLTLYRAASSSQGEMGAASASADRLIRAAAAVSGSNNSATSSISSSSASLPTSSVSSPVDTCPGLNRFSARVHAPVVTTRGGSKAPGSGGSRVELPGSRLLPGSAGNAARIRVDWRGRTGEGTAAASAATAAAAAGDAADNVGDCDVRSAVTFLDSVGAAVTGVELLLDEGGEACVGMFLSCEPATATAATAAPAAAAAMAVEEGALGVQNGGSVPCRHQVRPQRMGLNHQDESYICS